MAHWYFGHGIGAAEMVATLRRTVEGGEYASTSEIVREAVRNWYTKQADYQRKMERLRIAITEGDVDESIPADEIYAELYQMILERRATSGV